MTYVSKLALTAGLLVANPVMAETVWQVDRAARTLEFSVNLGGRDTTGRFEQWEAEINFDPKVPNEATVVVTVDIGSVTIEAPQAAGAIQAPAWLNAAEHPQAIFSAEGLDWQTTGELTAPGRLALKGAETNLTLTGMLEISGSRATADLTGMILRGDHDVGTADPAVSPEVKVQVTLIATQN